jgi:GNAT superfamily N-acetyltransferase
VPVQIRTATLHDADAIAAIHVASWRAHYAGIMSPEMIESRSLDKRCSQWRACLLDPVRLTFLLRDDSGADAGFISAIICEPDAPFGAYLQTLYLAPGATGEGYGKALFYQLVRELLARGITTLSLRTLRLNRARSFYERLGARIVPEGIPEDAGLFDDVVYAFDDLAAVGDFRS